MRTSSRARARWSVSWAVRSCSLLQPPNGVLYSNCELATQPPPPPPPPTGQIAVGMVDEKAVLDREILLSVSKLRQLRTGTQTFLRPGGHPPPRPCSDNRPCRRPATTTRRVIGRANTGNIRQEDLVEDCPGALDRTGRGSHPPCLCRQLLSLLDQQRPQLLCTGSSW